MIDAFPNPVNCRKGFRAFLLIGLSTCCQIPAASSQGIDSFSAVKSIQAEYHASISYDSYILGPGDGLEIELVDLPELSGRFTVGPDGSLYLPRLRALYVEGLSIEGLRKLLNEQFKTYVIDPEVYVRPVAYRPIRVYVGGEVKRPGYYTLSGVQDISKDLSNGTNNTKGSDSRVMLPQGIFVDSGSVGLSPGPYQQTSLAGGSLRG